MRVKMFAQVTADGTAAAETALCEKHVGMKDDFPMDTSEGDEESKLVDCSGNEALACSYCGAKVGEVLFRISMTQTVTSHRGYTEEEMIELGFPAEMFTAEHPSITVAMEQSLYEDFETKQALEELLERDGDVGTETITIWAPGRVYDHDADPDSDAEPGDRCKHCGEDITWVGPDLYDYMHVDDIENQ